jgi:hypothetical protein
MATQVRPTARPEPFSVWANSLLPLPDLQRMPARRAWKLSKLEHELIYR